MDFADLQLNFWGDLTADKAGMAEATGSLELPVPLSEDDGTFAPVVEMPAPEV